MADPTALRLLDHPVPTEVAAELLGVDLDLFAGTADLTLRRAFRLALRPLLDARQAARGARRAVLRGEIAANRRAMASVDAARLALALGVEARQLGGEIEAVAALLASFDPAAADRLRLACEAARIAASAEIHNLENFAKTEGKPA